MGVSVESCGQYDLPQAPPCLDGNCLRAGSTADQREGGGGRGHPVPGTGHSASSCFTRILLFLFFFFFRLWLLPCCGQGLLHIICLSASNLSSQHLRLRPHRSDQVCLGPIRLLRHLLCRLPAPALLSQGHRPRLPRLWRSQTTGQPSTTLATRWPTRRVRHTSTTRKAGRATMSPAATTMSTPRVLSSQSTMRPELMASARPEMLSKAPFK